MRIVAVGAVVAFSVAIVCYFFCSADDEVEVPKRRASPIQDKGGLTKKPEAGKVVERGEGNAFSEITKEVKLTANVKMPEFIKPELWNITSSGRMIFPKPIFTNDAENVLCGLLAEEPGTRFVDFDLSAGFDEDFAESLKHPIEISKDDSPEDVDIKNAVIEAKKVIVEAMKKGSKPSDLVLEMRKEANKIADYRDLLEEEYTKWQEKRSIEEIRQYCKEANEILDTFGARHLDYLTEEEETQLLAEREAGLVSDDNDNEENN